MTRRPRLEVLDDRTAPAVVGYEDVTFASRGTYVLPNSNTFITNRVSDAAKAVVLQPDGRLLVLGEFPWSQDTSDLSVSRLLPTGQNDPSFGGRVVVSFNPGAKWVHRPVGLAVTPTGRVVVAAAVGPGGVEPTSLGLVRLTPLGTPDPLFADAGRGYVLLPAGFAASPGGGMAVGPDGAIYVGTRLTGNGTTVLGVTRVTADGAPDPTFGDDGWAFVRYGPGDDPGDALAALAVAADGSVVVAGTATRAGTADFAAARLTPAGRPDPAFGTGGAVVVGFDLPGTSDHKDTGAALALTPDGKVVLTGTVNVTVTDGVRNEDFGVVRLTADGTPDPTFGPAGDGRARVAFDRGGTMADTAGAVAVQPDGRVVVAGAADTGRPTAPYYYSPPPSDYRPTAFAVARLTADGQLDRTFALGGTRTIAAPDYSYYYYYGTSAAGATALALQPDGRVLAAGNLVAYSTYYTYLPPSYTYQLTTSTQTSLMVVRLNGRVGTPAGVTAGGDGGLAVGFEPGAGGTYTPGPVVAPLPGFTGSVRVARADFDGDGAEDTAFAAGPGGPPTVRVVSGATGEDLAAAFPAFEPSFTGGVFLAAGDLDGDGRADLVVSPDRGGGPRVRVLAISNGLPVTRADFLGIDDPAFRGGARATVGDLNGDGWQDLIVGAGSGGGPRVAVFDGRGVRDGLPTHLVGDFLAFPGDDAARLRDGVFLAAGDLNGDGYDDLVVGGGPGGGPRVLALDGPLVAAGNVTTARSAPLANFFAGDPNSRGGVRLAIRDADADGRADLVTGSGDGEPARVRVYRSATLLAGAAPDQEFDPFAGEAAPFGVFVG